MDSPVVLVNAKAYERGVGTAAVSLASACAEVGAWVAVQAVDVYRVSSETDAVVWAQHADAVGFGSHTGAVLPEALKQAGAEGTLLNHAEKQLPLEVIEASIARCKEVGLKTMVCADSLAVAQAVDAFAPDFIALELPDLIGGDLSIVSADPALITQAVNALQTPVLVGAGVQSGEDLSCALSLGAQGVLLASGVVSKPDNQLAALHSLYSV